MKKRWNLILAWAIYLLLILYWLRGLELAPRIINFPESKADKIMFIISIVFCGFLLITQIGYFFPKKFSRLEKINNIFVGPRTYMLNESFYTRLIRALTYFPCALCTIIFISQVGLGNKVRLPTFSIFSWFAIFSFSWSIGAYYSTSMKEEAK
jgi:hypothetical protein